MMIRTESVWMHDDDDDDDDGDDDDDDDRPIIVVRHYVDCVQIFGSSLNHRVPGFNCGNLQRHFLEQFGKIFSQQSATTQVL